MGQLCICINAEQFVDASDQVHRIYWTILNFRGFVIRCSDYSAAFESSACDDGREYVAPVAPSSVPGRLPLDFRRSSEFSSPPDDCRIEQASVGEVLE